MTASESPSSSAEAHFLAVQQQSERLTTPCGEGVMVWRRWGGGERTVVLQHGGHGAWSHWIRNIPALAERYTVLVPDLPGCGESDSPPEPYDGHSLADIVAAGLRQLIPGDALPYHLVGFSFGGVLAGPVAARLGKRLASVTLVGSAGLGLPRTERPGMQSWRRLTEEAGIMAAHRQNLSVFMFAGPGSVDDLSLYIQNRNTRVCRLRSPKVSMSGVLRDALRDIPAALNGIWGACDIVARGQLPEIEAILRATHPELQLAVIPDAGHWVAFEAAERFNPLLLDMLAAREA